MVNSNLLICLLAAQMQKDKAPIVPQEPANDNIKDPPVMGEGKLVAIAAWSFVLSFALIWVLR